MMLRKELHVTLGYTLFYTKFDISFFKFVLFTIILMFQVFKRRVYIITILDY
jgi:hypothetical protein